MLKIPHFFQTATAIVIAIGSMPVVIISAQASPLTPTSIGVGVGEVSPQGEVSPPGGASLQENRQTAPSAQPDPAPQPTTNGTVKLPVNRRQNVSLGAKIETSSGPAEIALAEYLAENNVKFYGAYWCAHCQQQKSLFGAVAASKLPYIECAEGGENSQRQLCKEKNIQMFPTWAIKGKLLPGTLDLKKIAELTGYKGPMNFKYQK
jgi:hypothetical protein